MENFTCRSNAAGGVLGVKGNSDWTAMLLRRLPRSRPMLRMHYGAVCFFVGGSSESGVVLECCRNMDVSVNR